MESLHHQSYALLLRESSINNNIDSVRRREKRRGFYGVNK
jgi:hypothetical protein